MKMSDTELTRQEEDLPTPEFTDEEAHSQGDFGNWPEIVGLIFTVTVCWLLFAFTG